MATMDFFEAQAAAHRTTLRLIALFAAAVATLVALTVLLVAAVVAWSTPPTGVLTWGKLFAAITPGLGFGIAGAVILLVGLASGFRLISLSGGGRAVADSLGGRLVPTTTDDPAERRLLNVVEEMAIASGLPVPPVYLLEEEGINAFAAGYGPDDAVIGVTRGTLELLDRDELQGVVAHEFSHVLNGDMRLNLRLTAVLFGILVIGIVGRSLVGRRSTTSARSSRGGSGPAQVIALAVGLMVIGYTGTFFGNLIKAAVSRQREFLADASSVQFTRNPRGISDALRKIGGHVAGSSVEHGRAEEMSHMFFGQAVTGFLGGLGATHPPLEDRIRAVEPTWDGTYLEPEPEPPEPESEADAVDAAAPLDALLVVPAALAAAGAAASGTLGASIGHVTPDDVAHARELIGDLPRVFHEAAHDPFGARAAIYALLIPEDATEAERALAHVDAHAEAGVPELLRELMDHRSALPPGARMTLIHIAMPALKALSEPQYVRFRDNLVAIIKSNGRIDRFEWVLHQVVRKELRPHFEGVRRRRMGSLRVARAGEACWTLLSALALIDHEADAEDACRAGLATLGLEAELARRGGLADREDPNQKRLTDAMRQLRDLHPLDQPKLLKAAIATVQHDGRISAGEHELLAGVAAVLDCPLPPLAPASAHP